MGSLNNFLRCSNFQFGGLAKTNCVFKLIFCASQTPHVVPSRSTYVLQRVRKLPFIKARQRKQLRLTRHHYLYDTLEDYKTLYEKQKLLEIILVKYVEGLGKAGDVVAVNPNYAYNNLLLPKLAVYASPENLAKSSSFKVSEEEEEFSSKTSKTLMRVLPYKTITVVLNKDTEWTIQPWHIKTSARKIGIQILNESSIEIPGPPIQGPNLDLHGKDFLVILTVNNKEKIKMRCKIFIWATKTAERNSIENQFWCFKGEPVFPEQAEELDALPIESFNPDKVNIPTKI